ncbi:unnamed protein product [Microthlaspi erraticum]|uniref:3'-5' exonuclease domain-containing protein n=1 Tax=Microthlaspi erraticum TaxID=1685480 RepID=A0A6D2HQ85_9BRAS|nr:unnamed protein product [Microthlaspi erraticum]
MAPTIRTITNYGTHQEFSVDFFGDDLIVTQTETPSVIRRWIRDVVFFHRRSRICNPLVVGLGVYWTPADYHSDTPSDSYHSNNPSDYHSDSSSPDRYYADSHPARYDSPPARYDPPAETLQLCVGKRCILIKLSHCSRVPDVLRNFLTNPNTTFVGVWNSQDAKRLGLSRHQLEIGKLIDIVSTLEILMVGV